MLRSLTLTFRSFSLFLSYSWALEGSCGYISTLLDQEDGFLFLLCLFFYHGSSSYAHFHHRKCSSLSQKLYIFFWYLLLEKVPFLVAFLLAMIRETSSWILLQWSFMIVQEVAWIFTELFRLEKKFLFTIKSPLSRFLLFKNSLSRTIKVIFEMEIICFGSEIGLRKIVMVGPKSNLICAELWGLPSAAALH